MVEPELKYSAFLSYSHVDTVPATRLHKTLESFALRDLSGRITARGLVPTSLRPIFRDRHDFGAGENLPDATRQALERSAALIVLCSPAAAVSAYVDAEIHLFRQLHPDRPVIPAIVETARDIPTGECIPPALRFDGGAVGRRGGSIEVLAADMRASGDGRDLATCKVVAALIGVPSDEVYRRAERDRRRRAVVRNALVASFLAVAGASGFFYYQGKRSEVALFDAAAVCQRYLPPAGAARSSLLDPVEQCRASLEALQRGAASDPRDAETLRLIGLGKREEAEKLQVEAAADDEAAGKARVKKAAERYRIIADTAGLGDPLKARTYFRKALALDPEDWQSLMPLGISELGQGNYAEARQLLERVLPIPGDRLELLKPIAKISLGQIAWRLGDNQKAEAYLADCGAGTHVPWDKTDAGRSLFRNYRIMCNSIKADMAEAAGDWDKSVATKIEDAGLAERMLAELQAPSNDSERVQLHAFQITASEMARSLAGTLLQLKRSQEAALYAGKSLEWATAAFAADPTSVLNLRAKATAHRTLGEARMALATSHQQIIDTALPEFLVTAELAKKAVDKNGDLQTADELYLVALTKAAAILIDGGRVDEGVKFADDVLAFTVVRTKAGSSTIDLAPFRALAHRAKVVAAIRTNAYPKAREEALAALQEMRGIKVVEGHPGWKDEIAQVEAELAEAENQIEFSRLTASADASFKSHDFLAAAKYGEGVCALYQKMTAAAPNPGPNNAACLKVLAKYRLLARDFSGALEASETAARLDPGQFASSSNRTHALMFIGRLDEARAAYLAHKGEHMGDDKELWEDELVKDLGEFEQQGLTHPFMAEVRAMLQKP